MRWRYLVPVLLFIIIGCSENYGSRAPWTAASANQGLLGGVSSTPSSDKSVVNIGKVACEGADSGGYAVDIYWLTTASNVMSVEYEMDVMSEGFFQTAAVIDDPLLHATEQTGQDHGETTLIIPADAGATIGDNIFVQVTVTSTTGKRIASEISSSLITIDCR